MTVGAYYFDNEINYHERRELLGIATGGVAPAAVFDGGGDYDVQTLGCLSRSTTTCRIDGP